MGLYTYGEHVALFGGPPGPGERYARRSTSDEQRDLAREQRLAEPCPTCGDSGEVHRVLTPKLDPRDPAFDYETFDCPDCEDVNAT